MSTPPSDAYDLAGGDDPPPGDRKTLEEILQESQSRRAHRRAAAVLVYIVVGALTLSVLRVVFKLAHDIQHISPSAVAMVASLVVAISVLTIALAKFSFGLGRQASRDATGTKDDAVSSPAVEALKLVGDVLSKAGEIVKATKP